MLFGLAHEFQEAPWHQLSGPAWRGRLGSRSQRPARSDRAQKLLEALPDKDGENPVNVQPEDTFNMDESAYYGQQPVARWREGGLQEIRRTRSA
jgi:hypothetical protein